MSTPLTLDTGEVLHCQQSLRFIANKRLVTLATWRGKSVIAKLFSHHRHARHEVSISEYLAKSSVLTPRLLHIDRLKILNMEVLLYEYISPSKSFAEKWDETSNESERENWLSKLIDVIAELHTQGIYQKDLHLNNFLIQDEKIFTLDLGSMVASDELLSVNTSLNNLGLLFAQFNDLSDLVIKKMFQLYLVKRNLTLKFDAEFEKLKSFIASWRATRKRKWLKKIFRNSTRFCCEKKTILLLSL